MNDYWIDINPPKGAYGHMGADDYVIQPHFLGGHRHHGGRHYRRPELPLFIMPETGLIPVVYGTEDYDLPDNVSGFFSDAFSVITAPVHLAGDVVHVMNKAAKAAGKAIGKLPVVGKPLKAAANLAISPLKAAGGFVSKVAHGERIDRAFLSSAKGQIAAIKDVAPYVKYVASFVPGVGTGVAAAIAAGTALADGRTITDAVVDAARSAIPGGALGKTAFNSVIAISKGNSISAVAMKAALDQLPPAARDAAHVAIVAAGGKNVREAALQAIRKNLPKDAQKAVEIGTALGVARNIQSHVINNLTPQKLGLMAASYKVPQVIAKAVPSNGEQAMGFKSALAILSHTGVNAHALAAARAGLNPTQRAGFDHGMKTFLHIAEPTMVTLVRGGIVTRGHWRAAKKGEKGTPGRLIQHGKVIHGHYVRA